MDITKEKYLVGRRIIQNKWKGILWGKGDYIMKLTERDKTFIKTQVAEIVKAIKELTKEVKSLNIARKK